MISDSSSGKQSTLAFGIITVQSKWRSLQNGMAMASKH